MGHSIKRYLKMLGPIGALLACSFLFSADGKVERAFTGYVAENVLERELEKVFGMGNNTMPPT